MQQEQTKTLLVNIITGIVIMAVLAVGYSVFPKNESIVSDVAASSSTETVAQTTALIGAKIEDTVASLKKLHSAVEDSTAVFKLPAFNNLIDFSVGIPNQNIKRENPFVPTEWKLKMNALEDAMRKSIARGTSGQTDLVIPQSEAQTTIIKTQAQESLPVDANVGASQNL